MSKRVLLLSFFYPPDLSAGSFRSNALVEAFERHGDDTQITVLTTQPNRYSEHLAEAEPQESWPGLEVLRFALPSSRSGFLGQASNFLCYAREVLRFARTHRHDVVVATSSRLMTAILGAFVAWRSGSRLYLDLRDIFAENLGVLFPKPIARPLSGLFGLLERWAIGRADRVNLVSPGFMRYFSPRYPSRRFSFYSNGVDEAFRSAALDCEAKGYAAGSPLRIVYAGNIGDGQGLELVLPQLALRLEGRAHFRLLGAGGRSEALVQALAACGVSNVEVLPPVVREMLLPHYLEADVLFLHLNDFEPFRRVLPSKLFEYAALGKPILAGVSGYAKSFIEREIPNAAVFHPCDADDALRALASLKLASVDRGEFIERYARERIMDDMAQDILDLVARAPL